MTPAVRPAAIRIPDAGGRTGSILFLLFGITLAFELGPGFGNVRGSAAVAYLAILVPASVGLLCRAWRLGVRFDDHGITDRRFFRTKRYGWPEVSHFADGGRIHDGDERRWDLTIVLRDGRTVTTDATSSGDETASPKMLAAIKQAAASYQIPADLTGQAVTEQRPSGLHPGPGGQPGLTGGGSHGWSPVLPADPASGGPAGEQAPAGTWSPPPGTEQQRDGDDPASRRALAWLTAVVALSVLTLAWAGLLLLRDGPGNGFGIAYTVGIIVLNVAVVPWSMLRRDRKAARASRAAAGLAGTWEQQDQPTR